MKFNLGELESLFEKIKDIIDYVETAKLKDRRMNLFLGNGEKISYSIPNNSIAHLLGIDTNYLYSTGQYNNQNSFELLKEMCDNPWKLHKSNVDGIIKYDYLFKEQILDKVRVFKENLKMNIFQTEFVCEYKKDKSFFTTNISEDCDYIVVKKYNDESIGVLYLVKKDNYFVPMSNRIYNNQESAINALKEILIGQEITLLTGINTYNVESDYKQTYTLSINSKTDKINNIYDYKNKLNCFVDITSDYQYTLDRLSNNRQERYINNGVINNIVESIANNKIINRDIYEDSVLLSIIDAWNDFICNNDVSSENNLKYTEAVKSLQSAKLLIKDLTEKNNNLEQENLELNNKVEKLNIEVENYSNTEEQILKLLHKK